MASTVYPGGVAAQQIWVGDQLAAAAYLGDTHVWGPQAGDPIAALDGSVGTGRNASTGLGRAAVGSMSIGSSQLDMFAVAFVAVSHSNWLNNVGDYGTFTLTSHLDGQFTRLPSVFCGGSGQRQGSITPFVLPNPQVGLHTITAYVGGLYQYINSVEFQVQAFYNVLGVGIPFTNFTTSSKNPQPLNVTVPTQAQNQVLCGVGSADGDLFSGTVSQPQLGSTIGGSVGGWCDYLSVLESPAGLTAVNFTTSATGQWAASAVPLLGYAQSDTPVAPKVAVVHTPTGNVIDTTVFDTGIAHFGLKQDTGILLANKDPSPDLADTYYPDGRFFKTPANTTSMYVEFVVSGIPASDHGQLGFLGADSAINPTRAMLIEAQSGNLRIKKWAGAKNPTTITTQANTLADGDVVRMEVIPSGTSNADRLYTVKVNGTTKITWTDTAMSTYGTPGQFGGVGVMLKNSGWVSYPGSAGVTGPIKFGDL